MTSPTREAVASSFRSAMSRYTEDANLRAEIADQYADQIFALFQPLAEENRKLREMLTSLRTQADNAAYNAQQSGITIDNAQIVRIFEGLTEQIDAALADQGGAS